MHLDTNRQKRKLADDVVDIVEAALPVLAPQDRDVFFVVWRGGGGKGKTFCGDDVGPAVERVEELEGYGVDGGEEPGRGLARAEEGADFGGAELGFGDYWEWC